MDNTYLYIGIFIYAVICVWIAAEADLRGHSWAYAFLFCVICSPLLGCIMFSHYKPEPVEYEEDSQDENTES